MKRIVLVFGLIAGFIITTFMVVSMALCYNNSNNLQGSMLVGYAAEIIAFSMIFVAIKNYRDKYNNGSISFGKAFKIGLYVALIASTMYVVAWVIDYHFFIPDFMDKYGEHMLRQAKATGASKLEIDKTIKQVAMFKDMYKNPLFIILMTYAEILPVGLIISLICALILKRKRNNQKASFAA